MKKFTRLLQIAVLCLVSLSAIGCASSEPQKRKPVAPGEGDTSSSLPWNRPRSFESNTGLGRMMPMSR